MQADVENVKIWRLSDEPGRSVEDIVAREFPLTIILNDRELVTLLCSPADLRNLAIGFLSSEGLLTNKEDIKKVLVDEARGVVRVESSDGKGDADAVFKRFISSGCGRGASFYSAADVAGVSRIQSDITVSRFEVAALFREFQHRSELYHSTGGVHSAALCDSKSIIAFSEDVGRHNAVDKIFGKCFLEGISTDDRLVLTSGRISSEILLKVARRRIPVLASKSAPTDLGVKLAKDMGITLLGFVRGSRMNVYANEWRVHDTRA
jgi:FdhD protein